MSTNTQIHFKFELSPIYDNDKETGCCMAYFKEVPSAIGLGKSQDEAEKNLIEVFQLMIMDNQHEIIDLIMKTQGLTWDIQKNNLLHA